MPPNQLKGVERRTGRAVIEWFLALPSDVMEYGWNNKRHREMFSSSQVVLCRIGYQLQCGRYLSSGIEKTLELDKT